MITSLGEEGDGLCASSAFVCLFCTCKYLSFFSSSWCQGLAAVCDFSIIFFIIASFYFTPISETEQQAMIEELTNILHQQGNKLNMLEDENKNLKKKMAQVQRQRDSLLTNDGKQDTRKARKEHRSDSKAAK